MLESIAIYNFQPHKFITFEFGQSATSLTGKSDQGKSSIIHALRWLCLNEAPKNMMRKGASFVKAKLKVDGHIIIRKKTKTKNIYILDGKVLKAIGKNGVPEEIQNILNVDEVNFQSQFEPHFWFSKTSGQVSKELNQIVNLGLIDQSLHNITARKRKEKAKEEVIQDRLKQAREKKQELNWVVAANAQLQEIEERQNHIDLLRTECVSLRGVVESMQEHYQTLETLETPLQHVCALIEKVDSRLQSEQERKQLSELLNDYQEAKEILQLEDSSDAMHATIERTAKHLKSRKEWNALSDLCKTIVEKEETAKKWSEALKDVEQEIQEKTKGRCPVCSSPITLPD